jgi:hypothetical protein
MQSMLKFIGSAGRAADDFLKRLSADALTRGAVKAPEPPPVLDQDAGPPRDTVQVMDVSTSMGIEDYRPTRLAGAIDAAVEYTNICMQRRPGDRIAVISFNTSAQVILRLTPVSSQKVIVRAIRRLRPWGGTDLAEGLRPTLDLFQNDLQRGRQRHVVMLTDGQGGEPLELAEILKRSLSVTIDVVGIGGSPSQVNEDLLRQVATTDPDGSCHYRFIKDRQTLTEHYMQLAKGIVWNGGRK